MLKGLILKDIYNVKFQIICGLALMIYPNILMWIAGDDIWGKGDLLIPGLMPGFFGVVVYGLINYMSITACSSFILNTISDDYKTGWAKVQRTMPLTEEQIVGGKMLATAIIVGGLTAVSLICNIIGIIVSQLPVEPLITMPFVMAFVQVITLYVAIMLGFKAKARYVTPVYIMAVLLIAAAMIVLFIAFVQGKVSVDALRVIAYAVIPAIAAVVTIVCRKVGRKTVGEDI